MAAAPKKSFILVVDDEEGVRTVVSDYLEKAGFKVTTASDGWQAVVQAEGFSVKLIVTDIAMPGTGNSGIDAYNKLRASPYVKKDLPIIFITGVDRTLVEKIIPKNDPRVRLMYKPVDMKKLIAYIAELA